MMKFSQVTNQQWANAEQTLIDCIVKFDNIGEPVPFTANPNDTEAHGREIFARCAAGEFGDVAAYVPPPAPEPLNTSVEDTGEIPSGGDSSGTA
jgi:hypothetical protein